MMFVELVARKANGPGEIKVAKFVSLDRVVEGPL
jgi:hypothetical protein